MKEYNKTTRFESGGSGYRITFCKKLSPAYKGDNLELSFPNWSCSITIYSEHKLYTEEKSVKNMLINSEFDDYKCRQSYDKNGNQTSVTHSVEWFESDPCLDFEQMKPMVEAIENFMEVKCQ